MLGSTSIPGSVNNWLLCLMRTKEIENDTVSRISHRLSTIVPMTMQDTIMLSHLIKNGAITRVRGSTVEERRD